ncbi:MAG: hypothetical protein ABI469_09130 [Gemmatimonadales bacterium]
MFVGSLAVAGRVVSVGSDPETPWRAGREWEKAISGCKVRPLAHIENVGACDQDERTGFLCGKNEFGSKTPAYSGALAALSGSRVMRWTPLVCPLVMAG